MGKFELDVKFNNKSISDDLYVVPDACTSFIGRMWIRRLGIELTELDETEGAVNTFVIDDSGNVRIFKCCQAKNRVHTKVQSVFKIKRKCHTSIHKRASDTVCVNRTC